MFILLHSIKEKIHQIPKKFLETLLSFVDNLDKPHQNTSSNLDFFNELIEQYNTLQTIAQLNTCSIQFKIILLHVVGALASLLCGIAGGLVGMIRGAWNYEPFKGLGIGLVTGYWLGATTLSRYNDMNSVGSMIGFFIKNLSPFSEDFFNTSQSTESLSITATSP
ncbi:Uncharacterised protein [Legionella sainthelensi]|uniref:hypothetical protein n=1 Tax=Legionella sainthelensi TaxID=28087 RepID=UPI000E202A8F|nr:hypothetical protein [Legionella sainthelensi]VEB37616.1 Uncharacterised protein [Legionella sainthelensi]